MSDPLEIDKPQAAILREETFVRVKSDGSSASVKELTLISGAKPPSLPRFVGMLAVTANTPQGPVKLPDKTVPLRDAETIEEAFDELESVVAKANLGLVTAREVPRLGS